MKWWGGYHARASSAWSDVGLAGAGDARVRYSNDLHVLDPTSMTWTNLAESARREPPRPRSGAGVAGAGGLLYVYGGQTGDNGERSGS